jgi:hypothetical protein
MINVFHYEKQMEQERDLYEAMGKSKWVYQNNNILLQQH